MAMPYLHATETKLMLQEKADLDRHEGFREFAYPDPLSPLYKEHPELRTKWGFMPVRDLLPKLDFDDAAVIKSGAPWTFGHGFTHGANPDSRIERIRSERKLEEHILEMNDVLAKALPWYNDTSFVNKTVLINMAFNLGIVGLLKFKNTLRYVKEKNYTQAAANMSKSLWYSQVGSRAAELTKRMATQTIEPQHRAKEKIT